MIIFVIARVLYDTRGSTKALAYILVVIFLPVVGVIIYFSIGINYRKRKLYSRKITDDEELRQSIRERASMYSDQVAHSGLLPQRCRTLAIYLSRAGRSPLTADNEVSLLINGEEKFPALLAAIESAEHHIHLQYYIYEDDETGSELADALIRKGQQGIQVRFMYDGFGSFGLGRKFISRLEAAGVETASFYEVRWYAFANRINYRNHRKSVIIDGKVAFVGGINVSNDYRNDIDKPRPLYWRDTHLMIRGQASAYLQYLFMCDWNFCSRSPFTFEPAYYPDKTSKGALGPEVVQIAASGPDSKEPVVFYSMLEAINSAQRRIYITSPYFIPDESLMDALIIAIQGGLDVKIIIPGVSDSRMVDRAAGSYYTELLEIGAQIYRYQRGFVHAKTMVVDDDLCIVGSANMDYRSFDLNFEVNAVVYSTRLAEQLAETFEYDLRHCELIDAQAWLSRPLYIHLWEKLMRLASPLL